MTARADHVEQTRKRIVEAAAALHGSVGPANTTVAAIAAKAGVTRVTVYRHFPDDDALFAACTAHWASQQRMPSLDAWLTEADPAKRLRAALTDLYQFFAAAEPMLTRSARDRDALPEFLQRRNQDSDAARVEAVLSAWPSRQRTSTRRALVAHALAFSTWRSLCFEHGLPSDKAVDAMVRLVC
jgi:AcrR family transcriptional regulator